MFRKVIKKLSNVVQNKKNVLQKKTSSPSTTSQPRLLTAEGWKRLMMKKHRKS